MRNEAGRFPDHDLPHPLVRKHPTTADALVPFTGDVEDWLVRLEVYTPVDAERQHELDYWRGKSDAEHAAVFVSLLSMLPAFPPQYRAKPPLVRRFPHRPVPATRHTPDDP